MAVHNATSQVVVSSTATLLAAARATRTDLRIQPGPAVIYIGPNNTVSASNGYKVLGPEFYSKTTDDVYAILEGANRTVQVYEEYT